MTRRSRRDHRMFHVKHPTRPGTRVRAAVHQRQAHRAPTAWPCVATGASPPRDCEVPRTLLRRRVRPRRRPVEPHSQNVFTEPCGADACATALRPASSWPPSRGVLDHVERARTWSIAPQTRVAMRRIRAVSRSESRTSRIARCTDALAVRDERRQSSREHAGLDTSIGRDRHRTVDRRERQPTVLSGRWRGSRGWARRAVPRRRPRRARPSRGTCAAASRPRRSRSRRSRP